MAMENAQRYVEERTGRRWWWWFGFKMSMNYSDGFPVSLNFGIGAAMPPLAATNLIFF